MPKLYEIADEMTALFGRWAEIEAALDSPEGVDLETAEQLQGDLVRVQGDVAALDMDFNTKAENLAKVILNLGQEITELEGKAKPFREEFDRYHKQAVAREKRVAWLKEYLLHQLQRADLPGVYGDDLQVKRYTNTQPRVTIESIDDVPKEYLVPQDPKLDRSAVVSAFKQGELIAGTKVERGEHVRVR